jgi:hypothetical protein
VVDQDSVGPLEVKMAMDETKVFKRAKGYDALWSSYDRTWFSGPDKQEILIV